MSASSARRLRVAVLGFHHESNTFAPVPATLERFLAGGWTEGDDIVGRYGTSQATLAGFLELMTVDDIECIPLVHADLNPMGTITEEAFEHLVGRMTGALVEHGPWDVVLLALHGAAVAAHQPDADGEIISRVRQVVGARRRRRGGARHARQRLASDAGELRRPQRLPHQPSRRRPAARTRGRRSGDRRRSRGDPAGDEVRRAAARHRHPAPGNERLADVRAHRPCRRAVRTGARAVRERRRRVPLRRRRRDGHVLHRRHRRRRGARRPDRHGPRRRSVAAALRVRRARRRRGRGARARRSISRATGGAARRRRQRRRRQPGRLHARAGSRPAARDPRPLPLAVRPRRGRAAAVRPVWARR